MSGAIEIRRAEARDADAVWAILAPTIRAGETYALPRDMSPSDGHAYWFGSGKQTFVAEQDGVIVGTYFLQANYAGGGSHVCNCGYMTSPLATGRGVARQMALHSLELARGQGFRAMQFNFVVSTNARAVRLWESLGFRTVGRLPGAFEHPEAGFVDALVMFQEL